MEKSHNDHEEWMKTVFKEIPQKKEKQNESEEEPTKPIKWLLPLILLLFITSFAVRLYFIYFVSNPDNPGAGWFGDAYHHWQIAYLTKEIGLHQGFLRLWDLKGMEYFWGLLHPLMTMLAFFVTGSNSVGVERSMTAFFGSISVVLLFLLGRRFWNTKVGIASALFAGFNAVGIFNDGTGMVEPIGIPFLLSGVYFWPTQPILAGLSLTISLMARGEYWIFAVALVIGMMLFTKKVSSDKKALLFISFIFSTAIYMKYMLDKTGNPIYPFYWNYVANIYGTWQLKPELTSEDIQAKYLFLSIFIVSVISSLLVIWKKPRGMFLYLLGIGNWLFLGATFGLGAYIKSYMSYVWYVRFMILPYIFVGVIISVALFYFLPKIPGLRIMDKIGLTWVTFIAILAATQLFWSPIMNKYNTTHKAWEMALNSAEGISKVYKGGGLLLMEGNPEITYALVQKFGVKGRDISGQMFDPYYYFEDDPYDNWSENRETVIKWLQKNKITTIATYMQAERYAKLVEKEPQYFGESVIIPNSNIIIYQVKDELHQEKF